MQPLNTEQKYKKILENLESFFQTYNHEGYGLNPQARYTIVSAAIKNEFPEWNFVGFYTVESKENKEVLEIGPYQSDILATAHILSGKGVCGTCWQNGETIIINKVKDCKNYIACDNVTKAEICVPVLDSTSKVRAVLDVDSIKEDCFSELDKKNLEEITKFIFLK